MRKENFYNQTYHIKQLYINFFITCIFFFLLLLLMHISQTVESKISETTNTSKNTENRNTKAGLPPTIFVQINRGERHQSNRNRAVAIAEQTALLRFNTTKYSKGYINIDNATLCPSFLFLFSILQIGKVALSR